MLAPAPRWFAAADERVGSAQARFCPSREEGTLLIDVKQRTATALRISLQMSIATDRHPPRDVVWFGS